MVNTSRPEGVPLEAKLDPATNLWRDGDSGTDRERLWSHPSGILVLDAHRKNGKFHGELWWQLVVEEREEFEPRCQIRTDLGLPEGPTNAFTATFVDGELKEVRFHVGRLFADSDELRAELSNGKVDGAFVWKVGSCEDPLFAYAGTSISKKLFKIPKPWPETVKATFSKGKLEGYVLYRKDGSVLKPDEPITDWGQETKFKDIAGYIERGQFAADAALFFPNANPIDVDLPEKIAKLAKLPQAHRAAAKALDALVRKRKLPYMGLTFDLTYYGFDCAKEELYGASDAKYLGIASNGSGDMFLLDITTGVVVPYAHEEGLLELEDAFPSLDVFAFAMLRIEAVAKKLVPRAAVAKLFEKLDLRPAARVLERA